MPYQGCVWQRALWHRRAPAYLTSCAIQCIELISGAVLGIQVPVAHAKAVPLFCREGGIVAEFGAGGGIERAEGRVERVEIQPSIVHHEPEIGFIGVIDNVPDLLPIPGVERVDIKVEHGIHNAVNNLQVRAASYAWVRLLACCYTMLPDHLSTASIEAIGQFVMDDVKILRPVRRYSWWSADPVCHC